MSVLLRVRFCWTNELHTLMRAWDMYLHSHVKRMATNSNRNANVACVPGIVHGLSTCWEALRRKEPLGAFTYQSDSKCVHDANVVSAGRMGINHDLAKRSGLLMLAWELNMFLIFLSISLTPVVGQHFSRVTRTYADVTNPRKRAYIPHATQA